MHLWGFIVVHPLTLPIADEVAHTAVMLSRLLGTVYGSVLQPTVEDVLFIVRHLD